MKKPKDHQLLQKASSNDLLFGSNQAESKPIIIFLTADLIIYDINTAGAKNFFHKNKRDILNHSFTELLLEQQINTKELLKAIKSCSTSLVKYLSLEDALWGKKYSVTIIAIHENNHTHYAITMMSTNEAYQTLKSYINGIINNLPGAVYWKDRQGRYMGCNKIVAEMAGFDSPEDLLGKTDYDLCWREFADDWRMLDNKVIREDATIVREEKAKLANGKIITELTFKTPLKNKEDKIIGIIGTSLDITERKAMEAALHESQIAAEAANEAKDVFIQNMSHDIRTPLSGIIGISEILEEEAHNVEEKQHAHWVHVSGEQLLSLLNSVLDIAKSGHEHEVQLKSFSVAQLLHDIRDLELPSAKLKHLDLNIEIAPSTPDFIISDYTKIHRIILNLLGNALKFTTQGYIALCAQARNTVDNQCELELLIKDTGVGIAEEFKNKVFDRFFKISPSSKNKYQGYGVGLNIVQQYIQLLKGHISLDSELGVGTTFKVTIPVQIDASKKKTSKLVDTIQSPRLVVNRSNTLNLLIVEDNPVALKMVEKIAHKAQCHYVSTTSAEDAFEQYKTHHFDLILTDIGLPGMSGNHLAKTIRSYEQINEKKPVVIIGLTAHAIDTVEAKAIVCGMNKIITKPFQPGSLQDILAQFFPEACCQNATDTYKPSQVHLKDDTLESFKYDQYPLLDIAKGIFNLGNKEKLKELLLLMITDVIPKEQMAIQRAHEEGNWVEIEKLAHKIKGSALYCGTTRLKYACQHLEQHYQNGHDPLQHAFFEQFNTVLAETKSAIDQWIGGS